jgi:hypothetical protein
MTLWGWIATPGDGGPDYIVGWSPKGGVWLPMISSRPGVVEKLQAVADGELVGAAVRLRRFDEVAT